MEVWGAELFRAFEAQNETPHWSNPVLDQIEDDLEAPRELWGPLLFEAMKAVDQRSTNFDLNHKTTCGAFKSPFVLPIEEDPLLPEDASMFSNMHALFAKTYSNAELTANRSRFEVNQALLNRYRAVIVSTIMQASSRADDVASAPIQELPVFTYTHECSQLVCNRKGGPHKDIPLPTCKGVCARPCCIEMVDGGKHYALGMLLSPAEEEEFQATGAYPITTSACLLCTRRATVTQAVANSLTSHPASEICLQTYYNIIDEPNGYKREAFFLKSPSNGLLKHAVKFRPKDYRLQIDTVNGTVCVDQSSIMYIHGAQDF